MTKAAKSITIISTILVLALAGFVYFRYYFPVADEGVKAGELNYFVHKGYLFKTYEGKLIQSGFKGSNGKTATGVQSYEFKFSVEDQAVADSLMRCSGKFVELRYKEYNAALPWRGVSNFVVDKIVRVTDNR